MRSILWKIAIPYMVLNTVIVLVVGGYFSYTIRKAYIKDLEISLVKEAQVIASEFSADFQTLNPDALDTRLRTWSDLTRYRYTVIDAGGDVLGESFEDRTTMENHLDRPEIILAKANGQGSAIRFSETIGYKMLYSAVPITSNGNLLGFVRVAVPLKNNTRPYYRDIQYIIIDNLAGNPGQYLARVMDFSASYPSLAKTYPGSQQDIQRPPRRKTSNSPLLIRRVMMRSENLTHAFNAMTAELQKQLNAATTEKMKTTLVLNEMSDGVLIIDEKGLVQLD